MAALDSQSLGPGLILGMVVCLSILSFSFTFVSKPITCKSQSGVLNNTEMLVVPEGDSCDNVCVGWVMHS